MSERQPSASTDHEAMEAMFATVRYLDPKIPFPRDEYGMAIPEPEPDDPDDE